MSNTTSTLNDLISTLKDGQEGFRDAAANVKSSNLKSVFGEYSLQRAKFAGELQSLAHSLGDHNPTDTTSIGGAVHRGWINLKSAISAQDEHAVLAECERGEDIAVAAYKDALEKSDLPANVSDVLQAQYAEVKQAHDTVRNLRDFTAKS